MKAHGTQSWLPKASRKATRLVHDAYASVMAWLSPPRMIEDPFLIPPPGKAVKIDPANGITVENGFESGFHGVEIATGFTWPDLWLVELQEAFVAGDQGQVFLEDGTFLSICPSLKRLPIRKLRRPLSLLSRRIEGVFFHLTGVDHENHGHFLFQHLPRLLAAREQLREHGDTFKVLVAPGHKKWQARYLAYFGISADRIVELSAGTTRVERLIYVPMPYGSSYICNPRLYREMRDGFCGGKAAASGNGEVLFISRNDAPDRRLTNEEEIIGICEEVFGKVEVVMLGKLPLDEQIRRSSHARLVIGPQGQGLSVVLFMRQGALVVMEHGDRFHPLGWCRAFCDTGIMLGVSSLRLVSGTGADEKRCWSYPPEKFREEMLRLRDLLPPPSTAL